MNWGGIFAEYMPRSQCFENQPVLFFAGLIGNLIVGLFYCLVGPLLLWFWWTQSRRWDDVKWSVRHTPLVYGLFILVCGLAHFASAAMFFRGFYGYEIFLILIDAALATAGFVVTVKAVYEFDVAAIHMGIEAAAREKGKALRDLLDDRLIMPSNLSAFVETHGFHVWHSRPDGSNSYVSSELAAVIGVSPEDALGFGWNRNLHPDDYDFVMREWARFVAGERPYFCERYRFKHSGTVYHVVGMSNVDRGPDGEPVGYPGGLVIERIEHEARRDDSPQRGN